MSQKDEKLKILHLEDFRYDAEMIATELKNGNIDFDIRVVDNKKDFIQALTEFVPDIILSDHSLPSFNSIEALEILKEHKVNLPFILITSAMSEEFAAEVIKKGAYDYILKDRLQRLSSAVLHAKEKWQIEKEREKFLNRVIESEKLLKKAERLAGLGSWHADLQTGEIKWSDESFRIYGYEPNEVPPSFELVLKHIHPEDFVSVKKLIDHTIEKLSYSKNNFRIIDKNGVIKYLHSELVVERNSNKQPILLHGFNQDISEIRMKELELIASENRYRKIVETAQEGIWMIDVNNQTSFVNKKMCEILGYSEEEMMGKENFYFMDEEGKAIAAKAMERRRQGVKESVDIKYRTKKGQTVWARVSANPIMGEDGRYAGALAMVTDITENKLAKDQLVQSEIKIRNFAKHLNKVLEDERSYIAREIHDELGQQLAGIKMGLSFFKKTGHTEAKVEEMAINLMKEVDNTIQSLRKIATELRPGILDTMGLIPSIQWFVKEFEKKTGIACTIETSVTEDKIDRNISTCFFRICQEALTNVSKHAQASEVKIQIKQDANVLTLKIADNGKGIPTGKMENPFSMGLLGMQERANIIDAVLLIGSRENTGTTIQLTTKLNKDEKDSDC